MAKATVELSLDLAAFQKSLVAAFNMWQTTMKAFGNESPKGLQDVKKELDVIAEKARKPLILNADGSPIVDALHDAAQGLGDLNEAVEDSGDKADSFWQKHSKGWANFSLIYRGVMDIYGDLTRVFGGLIQQQVDAQTALARVEAAVRSTAGAAGFASAELSALARSFETAYAVDADEVLSSVTTPLLTFTQITGETFKEAQLQILNISRALGTDLKSAAMQVGKALNDPIRGVAALREVGVSFSQDQEEMIKKLWETGQAAEAQKVILQELNVEFGGQAEAFISTGAGKLEALKIAFDNLSESIGGLLLPVVTALGEMIKPLIQWFTDLDSAFKILIPTLVLATAAWYKFNFDQIAVTGVSATLTGALTAATVAVKGFLTGVGPIGWILLGVTTAITAFTVVTSKAKDSLGDLTQAQTAQQAAVGQLKKSMDDEVGKFDVLVQRLHSLRTQTNLTSTDKLNLRHTIRSLNENYGEFIQNINLETDAWDHVAESLSLAREKMISYQMAKIFEKKYQVELDRAAQLQIEVDQLRKEVDAYETLNPAKPGRYRFDVPAPAVSIQEAVDEDQVKRAEEIYQQRKERLQTLSMELGVAKAKLDEYQSAYNKVLDSGGDIPLETEDALAQHAKTGADSVRSEFERLAGDLSTFHQSDRLKLLFEYDRRFKLISDNADKSSSQYKFLMSQLNDWIDTESAKLDEQDRSRAAAGIEAEKEVFSQKIALLSSLHEMGVSSYDELKQVMSDYYVWAKQNLSKQEADLVLAQLRQANLRWGAARAQKAEAEYAHLEELAAVRDEFASRDYDLVNDSYSSQIARLEQFYASRKSLLIEAGLAEAEITRQEEAAKEKIKMQYASKGIDIMSDTLGSFAELAKTQGKKGFETWKAMSVVQAIVDTYAAANAAYKSVAGIPVIGPALAVAAAASAVVSGFLNVNQIRKTEYGKAATGGHLLGPSHDDGGILIEAEGDEYITAKDRVRALGVGLFDFLNFAPLAAVRSALDGLTFPSVPMPAFAGASFASGGQVTGSSVIQELKSEFQALKDAILASRPNLVVQVDPLDSNPVRVSEIAEKGTRLRSLI